VVLGIKAFSFCIIDGHLQPDLDRWNSKQRDPERAIAAPGRLLLFLEEIYVSSDERNDTQAGAKAGLHQ
jgi:hypothetical protein